MNIIEIFKLFGTIMVDNAKANQSMDEVDKKAQGTHKSFGTMIGTAAKWGAALAVAVGGIAVASIKDASEAEASLAQLDAVLKSTGGAAGVTRTELTDLADSLEKTTKFSAESTQEAQALLLTFTNIGKNVFPEATRTALDMATALGGDAASQSIALGKALNDPTKGITALTRVGVTFTDEQKNVIKKLQETGDMAGAQKVILAELNKEFGGSAEAAGKTFAGQLVILKNAIGNVTETLGAALLPKLTEFLNWITPNLPAIANFFSAAFDKIIYIVPIVVGKIQELWDFANVSLIPKFKEIISIVSEIAQKYFPDLGGGAGTLQATLAGLVTGALDLVIAALGWIRDNSVFVEAAIKILTVAFLTYNGALVSMRIATQAVIIWQNIHKAAVAAQTFVMTIATAAHYGYIVAMESGSIWLGIVAAAQWLFNAALTANPIGLTVLAIVGLIAILITVTGKWDAVTNAIKNAWNWLTNWNNKKIDPKTATVTTNYRDLGPTGPLTKSHNAKGTDFWRGGETWVGEEGPEIVNLPRGSQVIPNDKSMEMTKGNGLTLYIQNLYNNRKQDIEELMQEAEMYRQIHSKALGGA